MTTEKLANLQKLREELVERRREEANRLSAHSDEGIKMLGQLAIEALDAVIEAEPPKGTVFTYSAGSGACGGVNEGHQSSRTPSPARGNA
jgi:hypothetical protein